MADPCLSTRALRLLSITFLMTGGLFCDSTPEVSPRRPVRTENTSPQDPDPSSSGKAESDWTILTWAPNISSDCRCFNDPQGLTVPIGNDCHEDGGRVYRWLLGAYSEDTNFLNPSKVAHQDPALEYSFTPRTQGGYQVVLGMDKINYVEYQDRITTVCLGDNWDIHSGYRQPDLSKPLQIRVRIHLNHAEGYANDRLGEPRMRVLAGAAFTWKEKSHFMEVNLWRTDGFDYCFEQINKGGGNEPVMPCDPEQIYDRRSKWGAGEQVVYHGSAIERVTGTALPDLVINAPNFVEYRLPIDRLIRKYPWQELPESWDQARCNGVYVGIELYGLSKMEISIEDYCLMQKGMIHR